METIIAVVIILVLIFIISMNRKSPDPRIKSSAEENEVSPSKQSNSMKQTPRRRTLKNRKNRPVVNRSLSEQYKYHEGTEIEDVLLYVWLLNDLNYDTDIKQNIWDVEGVEGISWISYEDSVVTFYNNRDEAVMEFMENEGGVITAKDLIETTLVYFVDSASGKITVERAGETETLIYDETKGWSSIDESSEESMQTSNEMETVVSVAASAAVINEVVEEVSERFESSVEETTKAYNDYSAPSESNYNSGNDSTSSSNDSGGSSSDSGGSSSVD